jgi:hypothetical protein
MTVLERVCRRPVSHISASQLVLHRLAWSFLSGFHTASPPMIRVAPTFFSGIFNATDEIDPTCTKFDKFDHESTQKRAKATWDCPSLSSWRDETYAFSGRCDSKYPPFHIFGVQAPIHPFIEAPLNTIHPSIHSSHPIKGLTHTKLRP